MEYAAIVLCRMDSSRLPGKVLHDIYGQPLIWYSVVKCMQIKSIEVIIATTTRVIDNPIERWAKTEGLKVFRGSVNNVALRIKDCVNYHGVDYFFRVNADSPFLEPDLLEQAKSLIDKDRSLDFVTNLLPRTFPYGVSVECLDSLFFSKMYENMISNKHQEHPTTYIYENIEGVSFVNITCPMANLNKVRLTVDVKEDLVMFKKLVKLFLPDWKSVSYLDALDAMQRCKNG